MKHTPHHDRLQAVLPQLRTELESAAISDAVLRVEIRADGTVAAAQLLPRREFAGCGDERLAREAEIKRGEYAACWVLGEIEGIPGEDNPVARVGVRGATDWPPADLDDLLRQRTESIWHTLAPDIRRVSDVDEVLMLIFRGSGIYTMQRGMLPRAQLVASGHPEFAERPTLRQGEVWACWGCAVDRATGRNVAVRLSAVAETKGGEA